jgi:hypothetical protein
LWPGTQKTDTQAGSVASDWYCTFGHGVCKQAPLKKKHRQNIADACL